MRLRKLSKLIIFCFVVLFLFYFIRRKEKVLENAIDKDKVEDFDIILVNDKLETAIASAKESVLNFLKS